jgi:tRNA uracil 4-sulfurtransferase
MAQLGMFAINPAMDLSVYDRRPSNPGAKGQHHYRIKPDSCSAQAFACRRGVGIIFQVDWESELLPERSGNIAAIPTCQGIGIVYQAALRVHRPCAANPNASKVAFPDTASLKQAFDARSQSVHSASEALFSLGRQNRALRYGALLVHNRHGHFRAANINPDSVLFLSFGNHGCRLERPISRKRVNLKQPVMLARGPAAEMISAKQHRWYYVAMPHDALTQHTILVHFGELGLKGKNQPTFRKQLRRNIRCKLKSLGFDWPVRDAAGVFTIHVPEASAGVCIDHVLSGLRQVFGIAWITCARRLRPLSFTPESRARDMAELEDQLCAMAEAQFSAGKSFCIRANRANKFLPFTSCALEAQLGQVVRDRTSWNKVSLKKPDVTFYLEMRSAGTFIYGAKMRGACGLPVATSGRVLTLLSGGIDSPVAAWLMAKRGCQVDFLHFTATTVHQEEALDYKVWRLARQLSEFTLGSRLFLVPYVYFDLALMRQRADYELILFRRFMARVAEKLARQIKAHALVTGDNLSQVASQTLSNIVSTSQATTLPILRPLIGFDKSETIALAEQIGTYSISIEPYKDCCALITSAPKTRSKHARLAELEARLFPDYEKLIDQTLAEALCLETSRPNPISQAFVQKCTQTSVPS